MVIRYSKILLTASMACLVSLVALGNLTDYGSNFQFVQHVLRMDTIFPAASIGHRAIESVAWHHVAYLLIIVTEVITACLCWAGAWQLFGNRHRTAAVFNRSKRLAIVGLTLGFLLWQLGFVAIGGEWFGMWMSEQWNGVPSAFRFAVMLLLVLVYLVQPDGEQSDDA